MRLRLVLLVPVVLIGCDEPRPAVPDIMPAVISDSTGPVRFDSAGQSWLRLRSVRWMRASGETRRDAHERFLVREARTDLCCQQSEDGTQTVFDVTVWRDTAEQAPPLWSHRLEGDDAELRDGWYRVVTRGCCDSSDLFEFYRLQDGARVFRASSDWNSGDSILPGLEVPNSNLERSVAFHDKFAQQIPEEADADSTVVGVIQYGSRHGPVQRYVLSTASPTRLAARLERLTLVINDTASSLPARSLWASDGRSDPNAVSGFAVRIQLLTFEDTVSSVMVEIPVVNDRLDVARASGLQHLRIRRVR
jgi:hypothetical protein